MIKPNFTFSDICPYTWRNLGEVMEHLIPRRNILYILHTSGQIQKAAFSDNTLCSLALTEYDPLCFSPDRFFQTYPQLDEIHVLEFTSLIHYYTAVQRVSLAEKTSTEYLDFITDYYSSHKGIDIYRKKKYANNFYRKFLTYARLHLWDPQMLFFIVIRSNRIWFDAILTFEHGRISAVRTLDTLQDDSWYTNASPDLDLACEMLHQKFHCPIRKIQCEYNELPHLTDFWEHYTDYSIF